jgi:hypothetical protein
MIPKRQEKDLEKQCKQEVGRGEQSSGPYKAIVIKNHGATDDCEDHKETHCVGNLDIGVLKVVKEYDLHQNDLVAVV